MMIDKGFIIIYQVGIRALYPLELEVPNECEQLESPEFHMLHETIASQCLVLWDQILIIHQFFPKLSSPT